MTRDVSTIICLKRRGVGVNWTGGSVVREAQTREMEDGEDPQWYTRPGEGAGGQIQGKERWDSRTTVTEGGGL